MSFDCTKCGACCKAIAFLPGLRHLNRGDGTCVHLTKENLCSIYENRPNLCRVDVMKPSGASTDDWHDQNKKACKTVHLMVYGQPMPEAR